MADVSMDDDDDPQPPPKESVGSTHLPSQRNDFDGKSVQPSGRNDAKYDENPTELELMQARLKAYDDARPGYEDNLNFLRSQITALDAELKKTNPGFLKAKHQREIAALEQRHKHEMSELKQSHVPVAVHDEEVNLRRTLETDIVAVEAARDRFTKIANTTIEERDAQRRRADEWEKNFFHMQAEVKKEEELRRHYEQELKDAKETQRDMSFTLLDYDTAKEEILSFQAQVERHRQRYDQVSSQLHDQGTELERTKEALAETRELLESANVTSTKLAEDNEFLSAQVNGLGGVTEMGDSGSNEAMDQLQTRIIQLNDEVDYLSDSRSKAEALTAKVQAKNTELNSQLTALALQNMDYKLRLEAQPANDSQTATHPNLQSNVEALQAKVDQYEHQLEQLAAEKDDYKQQLEANSTNDSHATATNQNLQNNVQTLQAQVDQYEHQLQSLAAEKDEYRKQLEAKSTIDSGAAATNQHLETTVFSLQTQLHEHQERIDTLLHQNSELKREIEVRSTMDDATAEKNLKLEIEVSSLEDQLGEYAESKLTQERKVAAVEEKLRESDATTSKLEQEVASLQGQLAEHTDSKLTAQAEKELGEAKAAKSKLEQEVADLEDQLGQYAEMKLKQEQQVAATEEKLREAEAAKSKQEQQVAAADEKLREFEATKLELEQKVAGLEAENKDTKSTLMDVELDKDFLENRVSKYTETNSELEERVKVLQEKLLKNTETNSELEEQVNGLQEKLLKNTETNSELEEQIKSLQEKSFNKIKAYHRLDNDRARLRNQLAEYKERLDSLEKQNMEFEKESKAKATDDIANEPAELLEPAESDLPQNESSSQPQSTNPAVFAASQVPEQDIANEPAESDLPEPDIPQNESAFQPQSTYPALYASSQDPEQDPSALAAPMAILSSEEDPLEPANPEGADETGSKKKRKPRHKKKNNVGGNEITEDSQLDSQPAEGSNAADLTNDTTDKPAPATKNTETIVSAPEGSEVAVTNEFEPAGSSTKTPKLNEQRKLLKRQVVALEKTRDDLTEERDNLLAEFAMATAANDITKKELNDAKATIELHDRAGIKAAIRCIPWYIYCPIFILLVVLLADWCNLALCRSAWFGANDLAHDLIRTSQGGSGNGPVMEWVGWLFWGEEGGDRLAMAIESLIGFEVVFLG